MGQRIERPFDFQAPRCVDIRPQSAVATHPNLDLGRARLRHACVPFVCLVSTDLWTNRSVTRRMRPRMKRGAAEAPLSLKCLKTMTYQ
jgi:hypothetical protein